MSANGNEGRVSGRYRRVGEKHIAAQEQTSKEAGEVRIRCVAREFEEGVWQLQKLQ